jgi:hypothetical protein
MVNSKILYDTSYSVFLLSDIVIVYRVLSSTNLGPTTSEPTSSNYSFIYGSRPFVALNVTHLIILASRRERLGWNA